MIGNSFNLAKQARTNEHVASRPFGKHTHAHTRTRARSDVVTDGIRNLEIFICDTRANRDRGGWVSGRVPQDAALSG